MEIFLGTLFGIFFGAIPGLTSTAAVAILIPLTYGMDYISGISLLLGAFCGGTSGGAISAALLNIPGTPSSICTTFDAYPMVQKGKAGLALGTSLISSLIGGVFSATVLIFMAPFVANIAMKFGPFEYLFLVLTGLALVIRIFNGSKLKGFISLAFGILLSTVGSDPITGVGRLTFGSINLRSGIGLLPLMMGFFAISQALFEAENIYGSKVREYRYRAEKIVFPKLRDLIKRKKIIFSSCIVGTLVGILPGAGGSIASISAYSLAKYISKTPEEFGKGTIDGVIASETSNNAMTGGALIPTLALGIPGDACTAVMLGGMRLLGLRTGPALFTDNLDIVYGIFFAFFCANIMMFILQYFGIRLFIRILSIPKYVVVPITILFSSIGTYCVSHNYFDLYIMLFFGVVGYFLLKFKFGTVPCLMGFIMGGMAEKQLRTALVMYSSPADIVTRPIALVFIVILIIIMGSFFKRKEN